MRKLIYAALLTGVLLSLGCAITNYPVIFDTAGPWADTVLTGQYDQAYIIPSGQVSSGWADGNDELFSTVAQDHMGDQWLYTYNNFDPTGNVLFLEQTYCDPTRQESCWVAKAWNPDLPDAYPHGDQSNQLDDIFDKEEDPNCRGWRSMTASVSYNARLGECGSGIMADPQAAAYEFSLLDRVTYRGLDVYKLPFDNSIVSMTLTSYATGAVSEMPVYGRINTYLDQELRLIVPYAPNMEYQKRFMRRFIDANGPETQLAVTYGSLNATFDMALQVH